MPDPTAQPENDWDEDWKAFTVATRRIGVANAYFNRRIHSTPGRAARWWQALGGEQRAAKSPRCAGASRHGASRARTGDLLGAIQALSQLSYSPVAAAVCGFGRPRPRIAARG